MTATALAKTTPSQLARFGFAAEDVELISRTYAKGTTPDELALFLAVARHTGLDPFQRQIYAVKRWDPERQSEVMAIQIGIDGYRVASERTGEDDGMDPPMWCGPDGKWVDVWLSEEPPRAARVSVYRKGRQRPYTATALWSAYAQKKKDGSLNRMWRTMGPHMLAKCAEALARRAAFPAQLSNTTTDDEIQDAEFVDRPLASALPVVDQASAVPKPAHAAQSAATGSRLSDEEATAYHAKITSAKADADLEAIIDDLARRRLDKDEPHRPALHAAIDAQYALIKDAAKTEGKA